ncbi:hypothetical protein B0T21DRAFT_376058 [Apiosordaria backusii]|uniref:Uncharacterized protein n=1 Tax=Apiosordaria backusii TaxID=314023 RepID=A0AA40AAB4_9PEZI|nr:hypothetical protein B0T21DRAFT_376058 [Apiosordaria backusii]
MMVRRILPALALAQGAVVNAMLEKYVEVVHTIDVQAIHVNNLPPPNVTVQAMALQAGVTACSVANLVVTSCANAGALATSAPIGEMFDCLCCFSGTALYPAYSSCASYIYNSVAGATASFSAMSVIWDGCLSISPICSNRPTTPRTSAVVVTTTQDTVATTARDTVTAGPSSTPRACASFANIVRSCSSKIPNFTAISDRELAECMCYDPFGSYTTVAEDYASTCAAWATTAEPTDYSIFAAFTTFCDEFPPGGGGFTARGSSAGGSGNGNGDIVFTSAGTRGFGNGNIIDIIPTASPSTPPANDEQSTSTPTTSATRPSGAMSLSDARFGLLSWTLLVLSVYVLF